MKVVYAENHAAHDPQAYFKAGRFVDHPEKPARADEIAKAVRKAGHDILEPRSFGAGPRAAVHAPDYLSFLEGIHRRWREQGGLSEEVLPNAHHTRNSTFCPEGVVGQAGYYVADMSSPIGPQTWAVACEGADTALTATRLVLDGEREAYALVRPPGHHAYSDMAGGFSFINNIAISAQYAREHGKRTAILDVDVHHGNGTQGIFYRRRDVFTVSLHCDTANFYPWFSGQANERGEGDGLGANLNFPLPQGTGDNAYLSTLDEALGLIRHFGPDILFVAMGLDGYEKDPLDGFRITTAGFARIAHAIAQLGLPTVLVQEGGYHVEDLGANAVSFLEGFLEARG